MTENLFIGRIKELEFYTSELGRSDQFHDPMRIFYLRGIPGMGKRHFHKALWKRMHRAQAGVVWLRPSAWDNLGESEERLMAFANSAEANTAELKKRLEDFKTAFEARINASSVPAGTSSRPEASRAPFNNENTDARLSSLPPAARAWHECFNAAFAGAQKGEERTRVVFVLDEYDTYSADIKGWFSKNLFEPLAGGGPAVDARFLLSGTQSFFKTLDLEQYWIPFQTDVQEVDLSPLSPQETLELVKATGVLVSADVDIYAETGGVPGKIVQLLSRGHVGTQALYRTGDVEELFKGAGEDKRMWLLGAVHLGRFDEEALSIFCPGGNVQAALTWLGSLPAPKINESSGLYTMDARWSEAILNWQKQTDKSTFESMDARVAQWKSVCERLPSRSLRRALGQLGMFEHFNSELIRAVYPQEAQSLTALVNKHEQYFQRSLTNTRISPKYKQPVADYIDLTGLATTHRALKDRAAELWQRTQASLTEEVNTLQRKAAQARTAVESSQTKIEPVQQQVHSRQHALLAGNHQKEAGKPSAQAPKTKQPALLCLCLKLFGAGALVMGLMNPATGITWLAMGMLLIAAGMFWPEQAAAQNTTSKQSVYKKAQEAANNAAKNDTLIKLLELKKQGLESQRSQNTQQLARMQRRLKEIESRLNEPYV